MTRPLMRHCALPRRLRRGRGLPAQSRVSSCARLCCSCSRSSRLRLSSISGSFMVVPGGEGRGFRGQTGGERRQGKREAFVFPRGSVAGIVPGVKCGAAAGLGFLAEQGGCGAGNGLLPPMFAPALFHAFWAWLMIWKKYWQCAAVGCRMTSGQGRGYAFACLQDAERCSRAAAAVSPPCARAPSGVPGIRHRAHIPLYRGISKAPRWRHALP